MASSANLKPGEEGKIDVSVDTRGKTGIVSKTVQVVSNDPKQPTSTLFIRMTIKTPEQPVRQP